MHCGIDNWPTGQTFNITYNSQSFGKFKPLHKEKKCHILILFCSLKIQDHFKYDFSSFSRTGGKDSKHPVPIHAFDPR